MVAQCVGDGPSAPPGRLLAQIRSGGRLDLLPRPVRFAGQEVTAPSRSSLADDLAVLANGSGGELVLGVDEARREIVGIPADRLNEVLRLAGATCWERVAPPLDASVRCRELPDAAGVSRWVVLVSVEPSRCVHRSPGGYLRRVGKSNRQLSALALGRLFQERSESAQVTFDQQEVPDAAFGDLDHRRIDRFRSRGGGNLREGLAQELGLVGRSAEEDEDVPCPTVAGVLLASEDPRRWLPNAFIQAAAYRGTVVSDAADAGKDLVDVLDCTGPLDQQVAGACRFVARNQRLLGTDDDSSAEYPQYDMATVFEAVVNAVAHRDYSVHGGRIRLRMFGDRLKLDSPGLPPADIEPSSLAYRQASRNRTLADLLAKCPIPEGIPGLRTGRTTMMGERGEGVEAILQRSEEHSGRCPTYELLDDSGLRLTIFAATVGERLSPCPASP